MYKNSTGTNSTDIIANFCVGQKRRQLATFYPYSGQLHHYYCKSTGFFLEKYPKLVIAALEAISKTASTKLDSGGMLRKQYQNKGTGIFGNSKGTGTKGTSTHRNLSNKINGDTMRPF